MDAELIGPVGKHKGLPVYLVTHEALREAAARKQAFYGVWPYEGQPVADKWVMHKGRVMDGTTEVDAPRNPLLIDMSSANAWCAVYDVLSDANKAKMDGYILSHGLFCWAMEKLVWPNVSFGGR